MISFLQWYQRHISLLYKWSSCCRYQPSCSQYAIDAIRRYGAIKGGCRAFCRICRCNPFSKGGYDPA